MIPRYSCPEMAELWSDRTRYATWVRVEVLAAEAQAILGRVPEAALPDIQHAPVPAAGGSRRWSGSGTMRCCPSSRRSVRASRPDSARWVHLGMTSYDLVDTAFGYTLAAALICCCRAVSRLRRVLAGEGDQALGNGVCRAYAWRTRGADDVRSQAGRVRLRHRALRQGPRAAREAVAVGTISGSVGTYALIDPFVEEYVCGELGLGVEPEPNQVVARDRHAQLVQAVAALGACVEQIAVELRLLQRTRSARWRSAGQRQIRGQVRCRTSGTQRRASGCAAWPGCCVATPASCSRTWRSGTSGTCLTHLWSG